MKKYRTMILLLFIISVIIPLTSSVKRDSNSNSNFHTLSSTNPSSPEILLADSELFEGYSSTDTSYYYKCSVLSSNYGVIWILPVSSPDNYDLYVYTDSGYSNLVDTSTRGAGQLDWVVIKKGSETEYYPRVWVPIGHTGTACVEYDTALVCGRGQAKGNDHLDGGDAIELYYIYLDSTKTYDLQLTVPATGDFDLYLYYLESSITADPTEYLSNSTTTGVGTDEAITSYAPPQSGTYVVLIVWASGDGTFSFLYDYTGATGEGIPGFLVLGALLGLAFVLFYRQRSIKNQ